MQETVAHYRLRERLGSGAMGEVWLAEDTRLHRLVALKMLLRKEADDAAALARVEREARIASSLSHPNVAVVYDAGETEYDGRPAGYVAMEYVKGRTLAELLKDDAWTQPRSCPSHGRSRKPWTTPTSAAWCTATSSPVTSC